MQRLEDLRDLLPWILSADPAAPNAANRPADAVGPMQSINRAVGLASQSGFKSTHGSVLQNKGHPSSLFRTRDSNRKALGT